MNVLVFLLPMALLLGFVGLLAFLWALRNNQFEDLDGASWRAILDDDDEMDPNKRRHEDDEPNQPS